MHTAQSLADVAGDVLAWGLTYVIHSTVLLGLVWAVTRFVLRRAAVRDVLWKIAVVGGLLTASLQTSLELHPMAGRLRLPATATVVSQPIPTTHETHELVLGETTGLFSQLRRQAHVWWEGVQSEFTHASRGQDVADWTFLGLLTVWILGALFGVTRFLHRHVLFRRELGSRRLVIEGHLPGTLARLSQRVGLHHPPRLTWSTGVQGPMALRGHEICIPQRTFSSLLPDQQEALLAHELAHVVRRDPWWLWGLGILEGVLFFQPLNRLARKKLQREWEFLCDEWAAEKTGRNLSLARCLAEVATWITRPSAAPVVSMASGDSAFVERVRRLLEAPVSAASRSPSWHVPVTILLLGMTLHFVPGVVSRGTTEGAWWESYPGNPPTSREIRCAAVDEPRGDSPASSRSGEPFRLGVQVNPLSGCSAEEYGLASGPVLLVVDVLRGSAAETSGIRREDIITHADGLHPITHSSLLAVLNEKKPGDSVIIRVSRKGQPLRFRVRTRGGPAEEPLERASTELRELRIEIESVISAVEPEIRAALMPHLENLLEVFTHKLDAEGSALTREIVARVESRVLQHIRGFTTEARQKMVARGAQFRGPRAPEWTDPDAFDGGFEPLFGPSLRALQDDVLDALSSLRRQTERL